MVNWKNYWELCPYKVKFIQHGEPLEQYTDDKEWWEEFALLWDHTEIISFEDVIYTEEQMKRFEEIMNIPSGFPSTVSNYVKDGTFPEGMEHPLRNLQLAKDTYALKQKVKTNHEAYQEAFDNPETTLDELKVAKLNQLNEACNLAIVYGFTYTMGTVNYLFSSSLSAQANFQGTDTLFRDSLITEAEWTVENVVTSKIERVVLSQADFNNIKLLLFQHISGKVSKLRNTLQPLVESALTLEDVNNVVW